MSMMGYTEEDVEKMLANVLLAKSLVKKEGLTKIADSLEATAEFLEGLLVEGRV